MKYVQLAWLSKPKAERLLYKEVRRRKVTRIVEVGMGTAERAASLIGVAQRYSPQANISFTGIDWFEERDAGAPPLPLIHAHRKLQLTGARVRLVPGFPPATLPQFANSLQRSDLILISSRLDDAALEPLWFYLPRMCQEGTLVLRESGSGDAQAFAAITAVELERRAAAKQSRLAA